MNPELKKALRNVDWLRAFSRLSTLARALRHDRELDDDHQVERGRAKQLEHSVESLTRNAVRCKAPKQCHCVLCR